MIPTSACRLLSCLWLAAIAMLVPLQGRGAVLSGTFEPVTPGAVIDLSAEGRLDWAHWGLGAANVFNHKNGVVPQISNFSLIGTTTPGAYGTNLHSYTWTNGTPTVMATNTTTGIMITDRHDGFAISVPADTTEKRLKVYVGVTAAGGRFEATLSDSSAPGYADTSLESSAESVNGVYTLQYAAASAGQVLTVSFTVTALYERNLASLTLQAATLDTNIPPTVAMISPTNNALFPFTQNIALSANAFDSDGTVTSVEFFQGAVSLGVLTSSPYSLTWSNVPPGEYTNTARATDNEGAVTVSAPVIIHVSPNFPPTVIISNPVDEAQFFAPAVISIEAAASDSNGTVSKVEFFRGNTKLGERTNSPYTFTWVGVAAGSYELTAKATDNDGAASVSSPVTVFVTSTGGLLNGSVAAVPEGSEVNLSGEGLADWAHWGHLSGSSFDHKAGVVPLISNCFLIGNEPAYQYGNNFNGYSWTAGTPTPNATNTTSGIYVVGLKNGFQLSAPADTTFKTLKLYLGAYGARGRIRAYVADFTAPLYIDTSLDNSGDGPGVVYTLNYKSASPGQSIVVRFTVEEMHDTGSGNVTLQAATLVTDNLPPNSAIISPTNHSVFLAPANILIAAFASDSDGVSKVEFFDGATKLGQVTNSPYRFIWTNAPLGSHRLTARAFDKRGVTFTSNPVDVFVSIGGGLLSASVAMPPSQVNLTAEGRTDWAHWGFKTANSFDHRRLVPQRINSFVELGDQNAKQYADNAAAFTWTNGSPMLEATDTTTGVFIEGLGNGFQIAVSADTIQRRLKVYVGLYAAQGKFEASLSDSSAPSFTDMSLAGFYNNAYAVYTIDFMAASINQSLLVKYTAAAIYDSEYGNVTLQAATLALPDFHLRNLQGNSDSFRFSFLSEPNIAYAVLYSDLLDSANWLTLTNVTGNGTELFVTNFAPLASQRWYRVLSP